MYYVMYWCLLEWFSKMIWLNVHMLYDLWCHEMILQVIKCVLFWLGASHIRTKKYITLPIQLSYSIKHTRFKYISPNDRFNCIVMHVSHLLIYFDYIEGLFPKINNIRHSNIWIFTWVSILYITHLVDVRFVTYKITLPSITN